MAQGIGSRIALVLLASVALALAAGVGCQGGRALDQRMHHLGDDETPDWTEASAKPEPAPLEIPFESRANPGEWVLEIAARSVSGEWALELAGQEFARLKKCGDDVRVAYYPVPAGRIERGRNVLVVRALDRPDDDLTVGRVRLHEKSLRELLRLGKVEVRVRAGAEPLPARVTVARADREPPEIYYADRPHAAVRAGIAYAADGVAVLELPAGRFRVWASRGMEWSVASDEVEVEFGSTRRLELALEREVDTTGWVAADTHVHTLTYSGHGDSSVEERLVTLAGEGIELAVATDHNHHTDYRPLQRELALTQYFTPVVGNEVTSENGHMNAFPLDPAKPVPRYEESDWKRLVEGIRAAGARVVILNHPRWPEDGKDPLTRFGFDERTGLNAAGQEFTFDCMELVNSDSPTSPPRMVLPAWYALLERGQFFTGVGSSDSHAVGVIVGQGRTYVPSVTDEPASIDVDAVCRAFLEGRVSVSLGMFATIRVDGRGMGETLETGAREVEVAVEVRHPSWVTPRKLELVVNGSVAATLALDDAASGDAAHAKTRRARLALPERDSWIVAVASGDKVTEPFWEMSMPEAMAITNPVFVRRPNESR